ELNLITADSMVYISTNSRMKLNKINMELLGEAGHTSSYKAGIHLKMDETPCQDFFTSLPNGLFNSLKGIEASGTVSYKLNFDVDTGQPDSVRFNSDFNASNFHINRFGREDLSKMSRPFEYEARENDKVVKTFIVGPENHDFTPLESISLYLIYCVLTAEDGTFYFHKGFNEEAFRMSIATNLKEKRFARGGSTITMQLVKNVHLNRDKTISRKIEEALLVWLIENNHLCSKDRMLEVYLNIIEWGPGIYGITDAARYYFNKSPAELNLEESIYLSSIIPNPKLFRYAFDQEGNLRPRLQGYFRLVAGRLLGKEIITQLQYDSLRYTVRLNGPARELVVPADTMPPDSTFIFEDPILP
ncbi:MAG TPA: biosynthetic peptidoglycan transglycosylase, partial [Bacteroidia bacterium]|nr:biosynthetic peptidoglycan transglycosylase [Bacteroidia bacterium]